ncbi:MAG: hypothetical protein R2834_20265 [Rhodothermales bacterium]
MIGTVSEADTREAVVGASDRLIQALTQGNESGLRDLMSEQRGFQAVASGETYGAEPFLRAINAQRFPTPSPDRSGLALSEFTITPTGEAVATYAGDGQLSEGGKRIRAGAYTLRLTWFNEGGTWRISRLELGTQSKRGGSIGW